jgi:hypothetical protein
VRQPTDRFTLQPGDDPIVVAHGLGSLTPLKLRDIHAVPQTAWVVPST